jgi:hypothetical protein
MTRRKNHGEHNNMTTITFNGTVTFDESSSLQNTGISVSCEDDNDQDVLLSVLQSGASAYYSRLFDATELNLSTTFRGVGESVDDFITVWAAARSPASDSSTAQRARFCKIGLS